MPIPMLSQYELYSWYAVIDCILNRQFDKNDSYLQTISFFQKQKKKTRKKEKLKKEVSKNQQSAKAPLGVWGYDKRNN